MPNHGDETTSGHQDTPPQGTDLPLPESVALLRLLSCWSEDPLPLSLLSDLDMGQTLPAPHVQTALKGLLDQSLTEIIPGEVPCLRTHGAPLDNVWREMPDGQREQCAAAAARQLLTALPEVPERGLTDLRTALLAPHVVGLLRRVADDETAGLETVEQVAEALLRLVTTLHRDGDYAAALTLAGDATALLESRLQAKHPALLRLRERAARALFRIGRFDDAEGLHAQVLADMEDAIGPCAPDTLTSCLGMARPLYALGRAMEAVPLVRRAIAGRTASLGPVHPLTLLARLSLLALSPCEGLDEETVDGSVLVEDCRRSLGQHHDITLMAMLDYANAMLAAGDAASSLRLARPVFESLESRYGADYPLALNARTLLCRALYEVGQVTEAVEQAEEVLAGRLRVLGPEHPWTASARERLAHFRGA